MVPFFSTGLYHRGRDLCVVADLCGVVCRSAWRLDDVRLQLYPLSIKDDAYDI